MDVNPVPRPLRGAIVGVGAALPPHVVTNADLEARLETSDEWIVERTGIRERRAGGSTAPLGAAAATRALEAAGVAPTAVELLVVATTTPDLQVPPAAAAVHRELGLGCGAFDVNGACAGFVHALAAAWSLLEAMGGRFGLVVGVDCLSRITDPSDRSTAVLFGDGAGAAVVDRERTGTLLAVDFATDSEAHDLLTCEHGGFIKMEGREVFRRAVRATTESALRVLARAGRTATEVALFVPHQANLRIVEATAERLGIPMDRTAVVLDRTGNTSAGSIPLALAHALGTAGVRPGELVLLSGFGAGMSVASALVEWGGPVRP
jgi:3-oxoacyl-[acyl-carrier-protein] synthase-3